MSSSVLNRVFFFSNVTGRIAAFKPSINTLIETNSHISHQGCCKISLQLTKKKTIGKQIPQQFSLVSASQTLQFCLGGKSTKEIIATFLTVMVSRGNWVVLTWNYCVMWYYKVSFGFVNTILMRSIFWFWRSQWCRIPQYILYQKPGFVNELRTVRICCPGEKEMETTIDRFYVESHRLAYKGRRNLLIANYILHNSLTSSNLHFATQDFRWFEFRVLMNKKTAPLEGLRSNISNQFQNRWLIAGNWKQN